MGGRRVFRGNSSPPAGGLSGSPSNRRASPEGLATSIGEPAQIAGGDELGVDLPCFAVIRPAGPRLWQLARLFGTRTTPFDVGPPVPRHKMNALREVRRCGSGGIGGVASRTAPGVRPGWAGMSAELST